MQLLAAGHKRTGACPTFDRPVLQRDGLLLRIPLVGGALTAVQARTVAEVAASCGRDVIELTNRGNLQVRGIADAAVGDAQARVRSVGLGDRAAALVTVSPFAGAAEHALRHDLLRGLDALLADGTPLAPKFTVHVDDAAGWTAARRAEAVLAPAGAGWLVRVAGLGQQQVEAPVATAAVAALAAVCRAAGDQARVADVLEAEGADGLRRRLPLDPEAWAPSSPVRAAHGGVGPLGPLGPLGLLSGPDRRRFVAAGAVLGRVRPDVLSGLASFAATGLRVTPWRSFAVSAPAGTEVRLTAALAELGLVVDPLDPAAGVVACTGAAGCWQTEADTLAEAERQIGLRRQGRGALAPGEGIVHVTGCDKRCATRAAVAVTLVGRTDGSGFDEVPGA